MGPILAAAGYGPMGDGAQWHHHLAALPQLLSLLAIPLFLGLVALVLSAGRYVEGWVRDRYTRPEGPHRSAEESSAATPVLASDAEREHAASRIADAIGEARLSLDEGLSRIDALWNTRHRHELDRLVTDLPVPHLPSARRWPGRVTLAAALLAAVLVQAIFGLWELWPVAVAGSLVVRLAPRR